MKPSLLGPQWLGYAADFIRSEACIHWRGTEPNTAFPDGPLYGMRKNIERAAAGINEKSSGDGPIILALDNSPNLILMILGCFVEGRHFCVVSPDRAPDFIRSLKCTGGMLEPALIIADRSFLGGTLFATPDSISEAEGSRRSGAKVNGGERLLYLQPTSGSTGTPKCVPVTSTMLSTQCRAIIARMGASNADTLTAWVPLSHDMGLLAFLLMLHVGGAYHLSTPKKFMRSPLSWLRDIEQTRATLTTAPTSALKIITKYNRNAPDYRLETLRFAWIGAEPVWPDVVTQFNEMMSPSGLGSRTIRPTYGMAETVVGISFPSSHADLSFRTCSTHDGREFRLLSNGPPLDGIEVAIWDDADGIVNDGTIGRIVVRGCFVASNYVGLSSDLVRGWRDTGDLGCLVDGEVYVAGRAKDVIIRGGINHSAEQLEETVRDALGDDLSRVAAVSVIDHQTGREWFHIAIEARRIGLDPRADVSAALMQRHGLAPDFIHLIERGAMPMTSSGKIKRQALRDNFSSFGSVQ